MYGRLARRLPGYLRERDSAAQGRALLADLLAKREANFLLMLERAVYGNASSPYLPLLELAGCELGDVRGLVRHEGVEGALTVLHKEGVYVRFEELKGREPIRRGGREWAVESRDFTNPAATRHLEASTGGSTGRATRLPVDLEHKAERGPILALIQDLQGIGDLPRAMVHGRLPDTTAVNSMLLGARCGRIPERWFVPVLDPERPPALRFRAAEAYVRATARLCGVPFPRPERLPLDEVIRVARWAEQTIDAHGGCCFGGSASMSLRICLAARNAGIDLTGAVVTMSGEPVTEAKVAGVRSTGARPLANYWMTEIGGVGFGCLAPVGVNDQHLMTDQLGVIQGSRRVGDRNVDALLLTTLLPGATRVLLNAEIDDYGLLETRSCGCPLEQVGLTTHVRDVRSFKKLTAEGVTLIGSEMEHVLESELPRRFGGSPLDYQLTEEEDERGFTRICLNVSPEVRLDDESDLVAAVLEGLRGASIGADLAGRLWSEAGGLVVRRRAPELTARGKLLPLHLDRQPVHGSGERRKVAW